MNTFFFLVGRIKLEHDQYRYKIYIWVAQMPQMKLIDPHYFYCKGKTHLKTGRHNLHFLTLPLIFFFSDSL